MDSNKEMNLHVHDFKTQSIICLYKISIFSELKRTHHNPTYFLNSNHTQIVNLQ